MGTTIQVCDNPHCKSEFQDAKYGKGRRVHNEGAGKEKAGKKIKCTVCGTKK